MRPSTLSDICGAESKYIVSNTSVLVFPQLQHLKQLLQTIFQCQMLTYQAVRLSYTEHPAKEVFCAQHRLAGPVVAAVHV